MPTLRAVLPAGDALVLDQVALEGADPAVERTSGDGIVEAAVDDEPPWDELVGKMNQAMRLPGWTNAWTMPIRTRVDMLTTGVRTPVGVKVFGPDTEGK